tara:strand:- start:302 stop:1051 length:750 start_codon:yes stop_codon:yes gene_type:complete
MAKHSFFGGAASGNLSGASAATFASAGYNVFGQFDSNEGSSTYMTVATQVSCQINTPNVVTVGTGNVPIDNARAGSAIATGNGGEAATTQGASFMGGVNNGDELGGTGKRYYYIGCVNYATYNGSGVAAANKIDGNNVDGMYSVDDGFAQYETAGDVGGSGTDYTVCLLSNNKNGQPTANRQGTRITFRFANNALASGLSDLAYYADATADFGLTITSGMTDEQAAGRWLGLGYGLLKGGQNSFWDNDN